MVKEEEDQAIRSCERNEAVLQVCVDKQEINILRATERRTSNSIGHILRRNSFLKHIIEGNLERMTRRRIRHKQQFDGLKKKTEDTRD